MEIGDFESDFIGLPEYTINVIRTEDAGNGQVRIYHWVRKGRCLEPKFTALIAAADLPCITRDVREAAMEILAGARSGVALAS